MDAHCLACPNTCHLPLFKGHIMAGIITPYKSRPLSKMPVLQNSDKKQPLCRNNASRRLVDVRLRYLDPIPPPCRARGPHPLQARLEPIRFNILPCPIPELLWLLGMKCFVLPREALETDSVA
ncbi:hypothetical protein CEXT_491681 [Caerostris extrusa]|uniref:Uncharacterized protein n=1 Tax=Caerostris extrusa TaxID=172846 RepID=A0AAV4U2Y3_CAEEX|nr:hypothetical protein CEXT_491681 [Caerostris extrusa]